MNRHKVGRLLNNIRAEWEKIRPQNNLVKVENAADTTSATKVYIYNTIGGFDGVTARMVVETLNELDGPIELHVNSGGGDLFEGVAIYNAFKNYGDTVTTYVDGVAASAASFIAMAGTEVIMEKNATMMIHDGQGMVIGNAADMREAAEILDMLSDTIAEMYADKSGMAQDEIRDMMKAETWFTATEAVQNKLADKVNGVDEEPTNKLDLNVFSFAGNNKKDDKETTTPETFDVDGLRDALRGVFA